MSDKPTADQELVEGLLWEEEGSELDFKAAQYPFVGATDEDKSELLKDILASANAWRRSEGYILVGVREVKGGRSLPVGVSQDLDDADLQQFVNSKTQRPITFSYRAVEIDGKKIGLIHVPVQDRPVFLKRDFGRLKEKVVYVRRGSSTAVADPDEIARMGSRADTSEAKEPRLEVGFGQLESRRILGLQLGIEVLNLSTPPRSKIPDYERNRGPYGINIGLWHSNRSYYRELADYIRITEEVRGSHIAVTNVGEVVAEDVHVVLESNDGDQALLLRDESSIPNEPEAEWAMHTISMPGGVGPPLDVDVERINNSWRAEASLGKIQPKQTAWSNDRLFFGARESGVYTLVGSVFADNLPSPLSFEARIEIVAKTAEADLDRLLEMDRERLEASDEYQALLGTDED